MGGSDDDWLVISASAVSLDSRYVTAALLRQQYLPHVKKEGEELPPIFSTNSFTEKAAEALATRSPKSAAWVELRTRRFDGLVRRLGIPHPVPYAKLVLHIRDNWNDLAPRLSSGKSAITPAVHGDGRVIQMDYIDHADVHGEQTRLAQGKQYLVKADISNCFPSIYSHALDWALRGKTAAKADTSTSTWQAKVDWYARNCVNKETKGLLIGPAVSNLLSELILQIVDKSVAKHTFIRYIDDYSAYFSTREEAEEFVFDLQRALAEFRLDLNFRKTKIRSLREGIGDAWMAEVLSHLPVSDKDLDVARFLRQAELLAQRHPSVSIVKFAAKSLLNRQSRSSLGSMFVVDEIVRITDFHPHILPVLSKEIEKAASVLSLEQRKRIALLLLAQLQAAVRRAETDSILWLLYIIRVQLRVPIARKNLDKLVTLDDDLVWIAVAVLVPRQAYIVSDRVRDLKYADEADRQMHWLARYELWRTGRLADSNCSAEELGWMKTLHRSSVAFSGLNRP